MPNRYVRASAIESEGVNSLTWQGEVFWRRLINRADDFGRYTADPALVRAYVFPKQLEKVSVPDVERLLSECESAGLIARYTSGGKPCLLMGKWEKGRAKHSEYPKPPEGLAEQMKEHVYSCKHMQTYVPDPDSDPDTDSDTRTPTARKVPSLDEVQAFERQQIEPHDLAFAQWWHNAQEGAGWIDEKRRPIVKWKPTYLAARSSNRHHAQEKAARGKQYQRPGAASGQVPAEGADW